MRPILMNNPPSLPQSVNHRTEPESGQACRLSDEAQRTSPPQKKALFTNSSPHTSKQCCISTIVCSRTLAPRRIGSSNKWACLSRILINNKVAQDQRVHLTGGVGVKRICWRRNDGLSLQVERGVQENGEASGLAEAIDQRIVTRALLAEDRLQTARTIHVGDSGEDTSFLRLHGNDIEHEAGRVLTQGPGQLEIILGLLSEDRRREGTVGLTEFDFRVNDVFHMRIARIRDDAAMAKCARPPFEATLIPTDDLSAPQALDGGVKKFVVIGHVVMGNILLGEESPNLVVAV